MFMFTALLVNEHAAYAWHQDQGPNYSMGVVLGLEDFIIENIKCFYWVIRHPADSAVDTVQAFIDYQGTLDWVKDYFLDIWESYPESTQTERGRLHARLLAETLYMFSPVSVPVVFLVRMRFLSRVAKSASVRAVHAMPTKWQGPIQKASSNFHPISTAEWFAGEGQ